MMTRDDSLDEYYISYKASGIDDLNIYNIDGRKIVALSLVWKGSVKYVDREQRVP